MSHLSKGLYKEWCQNQKPTRWGIKRPISRLGGSEIHFGYVVDIFRAYTTIAPISDGASLSQLSRPSTDPRMASSERHIITVKGLWGLRALGITMIKMVNRTLWTTNSTMISLHREIVHSSLSIMIQKFSLCLYWCSSLCGNGLGCEEELRAVESTFYPKILADKLCAWENSKSPGLLFTYINAPILHQPELEDALQEGASLLYKGAWYAWKRWLGQYENHDNESKRRKAKATRSHRLWYSC